MLKISNPVNLIILNSKKQILLARRNEDELDKGKWSIPGGCIENKEIMIHYNKNTTFLNMPMAYSYENNN